jgi:hypothetical protein
MIAVYWIESMQLNNRGIPFERSDSQISSSRIA